MGVGIVANMEGKYDERQSNLLGIAGRISAWRCAPSIRLGVGLLMPARYLNRTKRLISFERSELVAAQDRAREEDLSLTDYVRGLCRKDARRSGTIDRRNPKNRERVR